MEILTNSKELYVIYMSIVEHWETSVFKNGFNEIEYRILEKIRDNISRKLDEEKVNDTNQEIKLNLSSAELLILSKAIKIGLEEIDQIEFPTIVGESFQFGSEVLKKIEDYANI